MELIKVLKKKTQILLICFWWICETFDTIYGNKATFIQFFFSEAQDQTKQLQHLEQSHKQFTVAFLTNVHLAVLNYSSNRVYLYISVYFAAEITEFQAIH